MVLAREYSKGLVIYRTDFFGHDALFQQSISEPIQLSGWYRRVNYDGSLEEVADVIALKGCEGAILIRVN